MNGCRPPHSDRQLAVCASTKLTRSRSARDWPPPAKSSLLAPPILQPGRLARIHLSGMSHNSPTCGTPPQKCCAPTKGASKTCSRGAMRLLSESRKLVKSAVSMLFNILGSHSESSEVAANMSASLLGFLGLQRRLCVADRFTTVSQLLLAALRKSPSPRKSISIRLRTSIWRCRGNIDWITIVWA